ncbi:MAG: FAD-linked oxidase C-terminal domain-containing protein [Candidatus Limnocylindrales bacterium]
MPDHPLLDRVRAARPQLRLETEPAATQDYRRDETDFIPYGQPLAVAFPTSTEDVGAVVRACAEHRVPVVARGGGSGLSGGANAMDGWMVLAMSGMDRILEVDADNLVVVTQPGVITAHLETAVEAEGLMYPPDPASHELSFIGGNIAENAGGLRCVKYGVTRDYVLGLEVVLADGEVIRVGGRNVKDVMGYDLVRLMVGSEGTLGIITEATLRLRPKPAPKTTLLAFFPTVRHAGEAVSRITAAGVTPVTLELLDRIIIDAVEGALHLGLDPAAGAMLMVESDAGGVLAETELDAVADACRAAGSTSVDRATNPAEADAMREARRQAHWSLKQLGQARTEDVSVPRSRVSAFIDAVARISEEHAMMIGVFGHAGDGNFHPAYVTGHDDPRAEERTDAVRADLYTAVLELGGTITGEHGTGLTKRDFLEQQYGPRGVAAMRAIKDALDPLGILNPGKVLPD